MNMKFEVLSSARSKTKVWVPEFKNAGSHDSDHSPLWIILFCGLVVASVRLCTKFKIYLCERCRRGAKN